MKIVAFGSIRAHVWCARRMRWRLTRHNHSMPSTPFPPLSSEHTHQLPRIYLIKVELCFCGHSTARHHTSQLNSVVGRVCAHRNDQTRSPTETFAAVNYKTASTKSDEQTREAHSRERHELSPLSSDFDEWKRIRKSNRNVFCFSCCWFVCIVTDHRRSGRCALARTTEINRNVDRMRCNDGRELTVEWNPFQSSMKWAALKLKTIRWMLTHGDVIAKVIQLECATLQR